MCSRLIQTTRIRLANLKGQIANLQLQELHELQQLEQLLDLAKQFEDLQKSPQMLPQGDSPALLPTPDTDEQG